VKIPIDTLFPDWHHATTISARENQFSAIREGSIKGRRGKHSLLRLGSIRTWYSGAPVAQVELAILALLGRLADKSAGELLCGGVRTRLLPYTASGRREGTPGQEVVFLQHANEETGVKAAEYQRGKPVNRNQDALPDRTEKLIRLSCEGLGDLVSSLSTSREVRSAEWKSVSIAVAYCEPVKRTCSSHTSDL
jgi:L-alanine-DL-glutamate epimerase-like enolase superfamily enzyme